MHVHLALSHRRAMAACFLSTFALGACSDTVAAPSSASLTPAGPDRALASKALCESGNGGLTLPTGFCAVVVADRVGMARHLVVSETGDVYVAMGNATDPGGVLALHDANGDGRAETQQYFGPPGANGILIARHFLYVAYMDRVIRWRLDPGQLVPNTSSEVVLSGLPTGGDHFRKNIQSDGRSTLWVNIGSSSNSCQVANRQLRSPGIDPCPDLPIRAGIWRFDLNAVNQTQSSGTRFAMGYRNTESLRYDANRRVLWGVPHGRDMLNDNWPDLFTEQQGADLPSEEFTRINEGSNNGWPYCYHDWQKKAKFLAPEYGGNGSIIGRCAGIQLPSVAFPGHWAPNDVLIYGGAQFPTRYVGGAFVAFHGGFDRAPLPNEGYNVVFVPFQGAAPQGTWETFADGFTGGGTPLPAAAAHRPMGLAEGPDGSLYVTDDKAGRVWRVIYTGS